MKYFLDTEFIEGSQKRLLSKTKSTIDLISIGIVCEDNREYYAISKDFNLKEAWNRFDIAEQTMFEKQNDFSGRKIYWIRDNVLLPIHYELAKKDMSFNYTLEEWKLMITIKDHNKYTDRHYKTLKKLIKKYGKTNKSISKEIISFCSSQSAIVSKFEGVVNNNIIGSSIYPEFYAYYADYDWVVFCWLFGNMIDLPDGFPMYCKDLKQSIDEVLSRPIIGGTIFGYRNINDLKNDSRYPKQCNEHNALADAKWNKQLHDFLNTI